MSADDAPIMYSVDPAVLADQYRTKFQNEAHRAVLLENALQTVAAQRDELQRRNEALEKQVEALTSDGGGTQPPEESGDGEAVDGSHADSHSSD